MRNDENKAVAAVMAACAGAGFSSGREIVLFFSQLGDMSWPGVVLSSVTFALLCAAVCSLSIQTGETCISDIYMKVLGSRRGAAAIVIHFLLMSLTAYVMLCTSGKLAMLALPYRNAFGMGILFTLGSALVLNMKNMALLPMAGLAAVVMCGGFYAALWADPRPVTIHLNYVTVPKLSGSVTGAIVLSGLHASLSASVAGGVSSRFSGQRVHPMRFGIKCGALMLTMLTAANGAILRGGEKLLSQALPTTVLAARWGVTGYYMNIAVMWLCATTTLAAALGSFGRAGTKRSS